MKTLEQIIEEAYKLNWEKGFHSSTDTDDFVVEKSCNNLHDEVSELHEAWRNGKMREFCDKSDKMKELGLEPLICLEEELADIIIRAFDLGKRLGIDVVRSVNLKHEYNKTRPFKHGGKKS
jgi:NTP pyrophosphatase (non-canonical NTP hydrolase)